MAMSDFVQPKENFEKGKGDYIGLFACSAGFN